jgi:hypothetical protein
MRVTLAAFLLLVCATLSSGEDPKPPANNSLIIRRPAGIDDATWQRLQTLHGARIQHFVEMLANAEKERIRADRDTISDCLAKRDSLAGLLEGMSQDVTSELTREERLVLANYVFLWAEVSPRLSGMVHRVGRNDQNPSLQEVLAAVRPGGVILLEEGTYQFTHSGGRRKGLQDIAIIGGGPSKTTLRFKDRAGNITSAQRVRIEGVKIQCDDDEFIDVRGDDCSIHLKDCYVFNYNSGAGGSYAIDASGGLVLMEGCTFEGASGRAAPAPHGSPIRHCNVLYARKTSFVDNRGVEARFLCTFDECRFKTNGIHGWRNPLWLRKNVGEVGDIRDAEKFSLAADDREFTEFVLGERKDVDERSRGIAEKCALVRHLPYWIRLLGHADQEIRRKAVTHFERLTGQTIEMPAAPMKIGAERIAALIKDLESDRFAVREAARKELELAGEAAREQLEAAGKEGTLERRTRIGDLLSLLDLQRQKALFARDVEFAHWMNWYEKNRDWLRWNDKTQRYLLDGK